MSEPTNTRDERLRNAVAWATDAGHRFASNVRVEDLRHALAQRDEAVRQCDQLRRLIQPKLDSPVDDFECCIFCGAYVSDEDEVWPRGPHKPNCPVLSRDALLGRDRAPAHPEEGAT